MICTVCKKTGHGAESFFQVIGFPKWWREHERTRQAGIGRGRGAGRGRGGGAVRANAMQIFEAIENSAETEKSAYTELSNEKWSSLIKLLEDHKQGTTRNRLTGKVENLKWVLDIGASNHMTGYNDYLCDLKYILPCLIGLPNGRKTISKEKGTVVSMKNLALKMCCLCQT